MIIDTHAHLYYEELLKNIDEILKRAADNGVEKIIVPAVDPGSSLTILKLSEKYEMIYAALGIHPCDAAKYDLKAIDDIYKLLDHDKVVAIGETGLDYYWDPSTGEKQKEFFRVQIQIAIDKNLPVVIHTRNSLDDAISLVKENYQTGLKGQFHCYSGNINQLNEILGIKDFYVSYCGNITYKNFSSGSGAETLDSIKAVPVERLLSETDSPFLPPVPYRGKGNEPSYIIHTMKKIAEIKETDPASLEKAAYDNALELFF